MPKIIGRIKGISYVFNRGVFVPRRDCLIDGHSEAVPEMATVRVFDLLGGAVNCDHREVDLLMLTAVLHNLTEFLVADLFLAFEHISSADFMDRAQRVVRCPDQQLH